MKKLIFLLLIFTACEKQPVEIQTIPENYLIGMWRQMDKYNFEWNFKEGNKFERFLIGYDGEVAMIYSGQYKYKGDSLYLIFTMQDQNIINPGSYMDVKIEELEKEDMIWSINEYEITFRKL